MEKICLAGDGWGAIAAFRSLSKCSDFQLEVLTHDTDLIEEVYSKGNIEIIDSIEFIESKVVITAGFKPIIQKEILLQKRFINVHYSLLPKYRGLHSTVWAILNDEDKLGLTIHRMNEFIDDGPIIAQFEVENDRRRSSKEYMELFNEWIECNLSNVISLYLNGKINEKEQERKHATWVGKRNIKDCKLDFNRSHHYIKNFFRALVDPYPIPFIRLMKCKSEYRVVEYELIERNIDTHIGRILNIDDSGVYISSKDGYIILKKVVDFDNSIVPCTHFRIGTFLD